jgi:YidC/Oxa1 family membrane protein insertase
MMDRGGPHPEDTRNLIIAMVLIGAIIVGFQFFIDRPRQEKLAAERARVERQIQAEQAERGETNTPAPPQTREEALTASAEQRVIIDTPSVDGTVSLIGGRIDDLNLKGYRRTVEPNSPEVTLLSPFESPGGADAFFGWEEQDVRFNGVGANQIWTLAEGERLTPETPIVLSYESPDGLVVMRTIAIDADYMFTVTDEVRNTTGDPRRLRPFGTVRRHDKPEDYRRQGVVHQGLVGVFGPGQTLHETKFEDADKHARKRARGEVGEAETIEQLQGNGGWLGITDHYWMTAIALDPNEPMSGAYNATIDGAQTDYRAYYVGDWRDIPAGGSISYTQRLFSGAKRVELLQTYQEQYSIHEFDRAVDWGMLWFLTRPTFYLLDYFNGMFGRVALAILLLTVCVKLALFPLVYQSFKSMAKMRALAPKMKEIQEKYAADKQRMQQEQMRLFQTEKVNPLAGCIPLLLQLPVFFALFKVLTVTIELRHAPFFGWISDLSAKDHTNIWNLFGLLPYDPAAIPLIGGILGDSPGHIAFLAIGLWPILNGLSMWGLQSLSPPPTDPIQAKVFQFLPVIYTVFFSGLPAGLVIYYTWSNMLTMIQQYVIMRRQGVETQLDTFIAKRFKREKPAQAE